MSTLILILLIGCKAAVFDISTAYCIMLIKPDQQHVLCLMWKLKVFINFAAAFGMASSAGIFGQIMDLLVAICKAYNIKYVLKWVDDFFVVHPPRESWSEDNFICLTSVSGVPWCHGREVRVYVLHGSR